MNIHLIQNYYVNPKREKELLHCLEKNNANPYLTRSILLVEVYSEPIRLALGHLDKATVMATGRDRESYRHIFEVAAKKVPAGDLVILANLDIFFDDSLKYLERFTGWQNTVMALTRWNCQPNGRSRPFRVDNSQDVWIWRTPLNSSGMEADFCLGEPGCDNRIAFELARNYRVINPCKTIKCHHYHPFECPDYTATAKVPPPYKTLPRITLAQAEREARGGLWSRLTS